MPFSDLETIEEALRERLDARALHEIWEQRQPVPEPRVGKRTAQARATTQSAEWIQYSVGLACRFIQQAFQNEEYWLVCECRPER